MAAGMSAMAAAREQFRTFTGLEPESVSGMSRVDGGWEFELDVVELRRVPDSASLLATYRVTTDDTGEIAGFERVRRFNRGDAT
jgi:Gas vesicle synthesis protein GvpO